MAIAVSGIMLITTIFCGIIALLVYYLKRIPFYLAAAKIPGPLALPIIGNAHHFLGDTTQFLNKVTELTNFYPSPCRGWLGSRLFIMIYDADQVKTVLYSPACLDKNDSVYWMLHPWLGTGLITGSGEKWRLHRKLITPTFSTKILESFVEIFNKQSDILTKNMEKELNGKEVDVFRYVSRCTLDIISESAMGVNSGAQSETNHRWVDSTLRMGEIVMLRISNIWMYSDFIFNLTKLGKDQRECIKYLHGVTNDVIQKKKTVKNNPTHIDKNNNNARERTSTRKAFLDLLMELSSDDKKFTDEELREEVDTIMIAGNDTTATVISYVMLVLANYPHIQERIYQELCEIYENEVSSDSPVKIEDFNRMEYMERVIKETMRVFPTVPMIGRRITDDVKVGDLTLPRGGIAILSTFQLHRSEKYWPDPLKFDPDRFLPEEVAKRHPYCYLPFSAGPRNCIGSKYAMMTMKVLLAKILRRYTLKTNKFVAIEDIKLKADVILKTIDPIMVRIEKRQR